LFSPLVIDRIRKEVRAATGYNPSPDDVAQNIRELLSPKALAEAAGVIPSSSKKARKPRAATGAGMVKETPPP
jgi:hypothetical protein